MCVKFENGSKKREDKRQIILKSACVYLTVTSLHRVESDLLLKHKDVAVIPQPAAVPKPEHLVTFDLYPSISD